MAEPVRHRQTKGAATDMFYLTPPRHISTLPKAPFRLDADHFGSSPMSRHFQFRLESLKGATTRLRGVIQTLIDFIVRQSEVDRFGQQCFCL